MSSNSYYPHRTWCDILEEMRNLYKTRNFSSFLGLIEELQIHGNRMEAALYDKKDLFRIRKEVSKLKKELKALEDKKEALNENEE